MTKDQALHLFRLNIQRYGGEFGHDPDKYTYNDDKLNECLKIPLQGFSGHDIYPTVEEKGATYLYFTNVLHPFSDGNKRASLSFTLVFLFLNGYNLSCSQEERVRFVLSIASGKETLDTVVSWIKKYVIQLI